MSEGEAAARAALNVPRETLDQLDAFIGLLKEENKLQNLVSAASLDHVWSRHVLDSAQLAVFAPPGAERWLDLGSGAGFPGLIIALLHRSKVTLVESRRLRADFLARAAALLGLAERCDILCSRVESLQLEPFDVISARAFAPLPRLLDSAEHLSTEGTCWILPKGRSAKSELEAAQASWQGEFRLEPSLTDPDARIIVAKQVRRRTKGKRAK